MTRTEIRHRQSGDVRNAPVFTRRRQLRRGLAYGRSILQKFHCELRPVGARTLWIDDKVVRQIARRGSLERIVERRHHAPAFKMERILWIAVAARLPFDAANQRQAADSQTRSGWLDLNRCALRAEL